MSRRNLNEDSQPTDASATDPEDATLRQGRIRTQVATSFAAALAIQALGLVTGVLAARLLGPSGNGELAAIRTWAATLGMVSALGLMDALVYRVAREPEASGRWWATARTLYWITGSIGALVGLVLVPRMLGGYGSAVTTAAVVFLLTIPLDALCWSWIHPLRSIGRFAMWNILRLAPTVIWLAVLLAGWAGGHRNAATLTTWYVIAFAAIGAVLTVAVTRLFTKPRSFTRAQIKPLFTFGIPALAAGLPQMLNARIDLLAISALMTSLDTGLYAVGLSAAAIVGAGAGAVGAVIFPRVAQQRSAGSGRHMVIRATRISVLPTVLITAAAMGAVAILIPVVYGQEYRGAISAGVILCLAAGTAAFSTVLGEGLRGLGRQSGLVVAYTLGALVTGGGIVALGAGDRLTIESAAVVTCLANLISLSVLLLFAQRACDTSWVRFVTPLSPRSARSLDQAPGGRSGDRPARR